MAVKAGVITNFDTTNYGSVLQAFALQKTLKDYDCDTYVLQMVNSNKRTVSSRVRKFLFRSGNNYTIKEKFEIKMSRKLYAEKKRKLQTFCENNIKVKQCSSLEDAGKIVNDRDILIAGSDQIWSAIAGQLSEFTTLQFGEERIKRCSYAASVGMEELDNNSRDIIEKGLIRFSDISVRETSSVPLISNICDKKVYSVVDPTLLYNADFWSRLAINPQIQLPYIFVYMLRPEPLTLELAKRLSNDTGYRICLFSNRIVNDVIIDNITDAGIEDFLGYIKNAEYVVTNSFHGTAFAVQFHKKFISVPISGSGMRVIDFLNGTNLSHRMAHRIDDIAHIYEKIDWNSVEMEIECQRTKSFAFLEQIL